jgi:uncharacterized protein YndB with AHSA1/START domain
LAAVKNIRMSDPTDRQIQITRTLPAPVEVVWDAWTNPDHLIHWWAPDGVTTTIKRMVVKEGEEWLLVLHGADGKTFPNRSIYREIVPLRKIVFDHFNPGFKATIVFEAKGKDTMMEWTMLFDTAEMFDIVVKTFKADVGLEQNGDKLVNYLMNLQQGS